MRWLRDTIAGRTIIVLVLGLGSIVALAQFLYQTSIEREVTTRNAESIAERLVFMAGSITALDPERRDEAAHRMSGGPLELHWAREPLATAGGRLDDTALLLRNRLVARAPALDDRGLIIGTSRPEDAAHDSARPVDEAHVTLISLPLTDGSWLNVTLVRVDAARTAIPSALLSVLLAAFGVVIVSVLMSRWLTRPLEQLAEGARGLFLTSRNERLPETGTREIRTLAAAINELQQRIRRMVDDRTQMLAAISHDLRTPLTRLRLRVGRLADVDLRSSIEADLDEMEQMLDATLAFLRDDMRSEKIEMVDLATILQTLADDATDAGHRISIAVPRQLVVPGRHLALKRALGNLVQNAVKYGGSADVSATNDGAAIRISVVDDGPGIPADRLEDVFEPFFRLDPSRGRATGGYGLGLTVARSIIRAHGGDLILANRMPRGLEARVSLPTAAARARTGPEPS